MRVLQRLVSVMVLTVAAIPLAFAQSSGLSAEDKEKILADVTRIVTANAFVPGVDFSQWDEFLEAQKEALDEADSEERFAAVINRALRNFGLSHIVMSTPRGAATMIEGKAVGIGIRPEPAESGIRVLAVFPDSPADKAGLQAGDTIVKVDGAPVKDIAALRGDEGSRVSLTLLGPDGATREAVVTRGKFSTDFPPTLTWPSEEVAVLKVPTFMRAYDGDRIEKLVEDARKAEVLVVDLRGNGGGLVLHLMHLCGLLMPSDKPMGTFVSRTLVNRYKEATGKDGSDLADVGQWAKNKLSASDLDIEPFQGRIVALIDGGSGSASEIVAAGLRDVLGATVVGERSAGMVLASQFARLHMDFQLQFPYQDYVTIKGLRLEGNGVEPDLVVRGEAAPNGIDPGIEAVLSLVEKDRQATSKSGSN